MNEDKMSKEAKCHECIHFPMCDWRTNTYLFADERFKCYCGHYANEKDYHKVGKDEVVLTKGAYESISNKAKANVVKAVEIKQEAAREILQAINKYLVGTRGIYTVKTFRNCRFEDIVLVRADDLETLVKKLAKKHGIELED